MSGAGHTFSFILSKEGSLLTIYIALLHLDGVIRVRIAATFEGVLINGDPILGFNFIECGVRFFYINISGFNFSHYYIFLFERRFNLPFKEGFVMLSLFN